MKSHAKVDSASEETETNSKKETYDTKSNRSVKPK